MRPRRPAEDRSQCIGATRRRRQDSQAGSQPTLPRRRRRVLPRSSLRRLLLRLGVWWPVESNGPVPGCSYPDHSAQPHRAHRVFQRKPRVAALG